MLHYMNTKVYFILLSAKNIIETWRFYFYMYQHFGTDITGELPNLRGLTKLKIK